MREIKFRAWDKEIKKMWEVGEIHFPLREYSVVYLMEPGTSKKTYSKFVELMQYTGLKDKNGKEIYEGDLLRAIYPAGYSICEVKFGFYHNGEEYEDNISGNGWYFEEWGFDRNGNKVDLEPNINDLQQAMYLSFYLEVIGNIHDNPELLKEGK